MSGWIAVVSSLYFAVLAVGYTAAASGAQHPARRVHELIHAVMGVAMAAMPWPWWMRVPAIWPVMFFTAAAAWYVYTLIGGRHGEHGAVTVVVHAVMSAAMVWMAVAMTPMAPEGMPGMHMAMPAAATGMTGTQGWAQAVTGVTIAVLVAGAVTRLAVAARRSAMRPDGGGRHRWAGAVRDAAMAAGMAAALLLLTR